MRYYILHVKNALSELPVLHLHPCKSDTQREDLASKIYNNRDQKIITLFSRFDRDKDLLLPITTSDREYGIVDLKSFNTQDLEDEDEE